jgi:membrane-bound metal-dependent hydrolase YbcI (DUF457 family)
MPTIISHTAIPLAIGLGLGRKAISSRLLLAGMAASILPDLDMLTNKRLSSGDVFPFHPYRPSSLDTRPP